jgi:RND family efflux transporter MFP subunit
MLLTCWGHSSATAEDSSAKSKDVYYCPMHPFYKADKPGECPICNMTLVKADAETPSDKADVKEGEPLPPGTVRISPYKQQLIGVEYGEVKSEEIINSIRAVGKITYDETRIARINPKFEGWAEKVYADFTGKRVQKDQPLVSIYSPELFSAQQEFLLAAKYLKKMDGQASSMYEAAKQRLLMFDIPEKQIKELEAKGIASKTMTLNSPMDGVVVTRNVFEKQRIAPEMELFVIADLSRVWVQTEIYEYELSQIKIGQEAVMTLPYIQGQSYTGTVSFISPEVDKMTRTVKVRLEFANPDGGLKPDMFAHISLKVAYGVRQLVDERAVLDSGNEQIVFVSHEGGYFEPRKVQLGPKVEGRYIVLSGLKTGEKIVISGNFLIDSESQIKSAIGATGSHAGHGEEKKTENAAPSLPEKAAPAEDHSQHQSPSDLKKN